MWLLFVKRFVNVYTIHFTTDTMSSTLYTNTIHFTTDANNIYNSLHHWCQFTGEQRYIPQWRASIRWPCHRLQQIDGKQCPHSSCTVSVRVHTLATLCMYLPHNAKWPLAVSVAVRQAEHSNHHLGQGGESRLAHHCSHPVQIHRADLVSYIWKSPVHSVSQLLIPVHLLNTHL